MNKNINNQDPKKSFIDPAIKNSLWFRKLASKNEALMVINESSMWFMIMGVISLLASPLIYYIFGSKAAILNAVCTLVFLILFSFLLRKNKNIFFALLISAYLLLVVYMSLMNSGRVNFGVTFVLFLTSLKSIEAVLVYKKFK